MYFFESYDAALLAEPDEPVRGDYVAFSHGGHGVNSYFLSYELVAGRVALFVQVPWGGVYMDPERSRRDVQSAFHKISHLCDVAVGLLDDRDSSHPRLVLLASDRPVGAVGWLPEPFADADGRDRWIRDHECDPSAAFEVADRLIAGARRA